MEAIISKLAYQFPKLCARALTGDSVAIAEILALAIALGYKVIKDGA